MIVKTSIKPSYRKQHNILLLLLGMLFSVVINVDAQEPKKAKTRSVHPSITYGSMPYGYTQVGTTDLCFKVVSNYSGDSYCIDIQGLFGTNYYGSTYANCGYDVAMQVGDNYATKVECLNGSTVNGVTFAADVIPQADLARVCYYITNTNDEDVTISLGIHADVMVGNNDRAPIKRKIDTIGNTYGLALLDGNGAQLCVLFGSGLTGVTGVSDFWFGGWSLNSSANEMIGNYNSGSNYMVENGSYDSGMGWCWKNRIIPAGETVVFSWLIGVGDVNLEPNSNFEVTPEDPEGWNDLSRLHILTLEGDYESPAGLSGRIEYAVEDSEEWIALTELLESGSSFTGEVRAMFNPTFQNHTIRFRTVDQVGNSTILPSIIYPDVAFHNIDGIEDKTYTGDSIFQTNITSDLSSDLYALKNYQNNVNAGTASFSMEGVFPNTIGRKNYTFTIHPQSFSGDVILSETSFVYNGQAFTPTWHFSNENYSDLEYGRDFTISWSNNTLPGTGLLTVTGKGNYEGELTANFEIDKAQLTDNLFTLTLPNEDITYDEQSHGATVTISDGVGEATLSYQRQGEAGASTTIPTEAGNYTIYLEFAEGTLYYGRNRSQVGTFSIYQFSAEEWDVLQTVLPQLTEMGWTQPWDVSQGMKSASTLQGLTIEKGHVIGLDFAGQNLTGPFPTSILSLPELQSIDLANNHLTGDIGIIAANYAQENPGMLANLKEVNISGNQLTGNIGQFVSCFTSITSLDASGNCLEEVSPMIPATVTSINLGQQTISRVVDLHLASLSAEYITEHVPSILLYDHANQTYSSDINLLCSTSDETWSTVIACQNGQVTFRETSEKNDYHGQTGDVLNVSVLNNNGTREGSTFHLALTFDEGDGNFDGQVNVLDLQTNILYIMEDYQTRPFNFTAANLWKDEIINVQDIICQVNLLMNNNPSDTQLTASARMNAPTIETNCDASVYIQNGQLMLNTNSPVAAFDIIISNARSINLTNNLEFNGMTISTKALSNGIHIIGYSMTGTHLPVGISVIGTFDTKMASVYSAVLSDSKANAISVLRNGSGSTTGIESIGTSTLENDNIYDMMGRKTSMPHKGIYIKNGSKIMK